MINYPSGLALLSLEQTRKSYLRGLNLGTTEKRDCTLLKSVVVNRRGVILHNFLCR